MANLDRSRPLRLRDLMQPASRLRYMGWRLSRSRHHLTIKLGGGPSLVLRPQPSGDLSVAHEIFVQELYRSPRPLEVSSIRRIVDVGANVGYAISYFAYCFPEASLLAFEPHPAHRIQIDQNLRANGTESRVRIIGAAAGTEEGKAYLTDAGEASRVVEGDEAGQFEVRVADFFAVVGHERIDLLKMDCEGAEYDLLMDPRFERLNTLTIVLEWHTSAHRPQADRAIEERLTKLDFALEQVMEYVVEGRRFGLLWAYRK